MTDIVERLRQMGEWTEPKVWEHDPTALEAADEIEQLRELVRSFVLDTIDYATKNNLGDPEKQHNVKWARKLGITDTLEDHSEP